MIVSHICHWHHIYFTHIYSLIMISSLSIIIVFVIVLTIFFFTVYRCCTLCVSLSSTLPLIKYQNFMLPRSLLLVIFLELKLLKNFSSIFDSFFVHLCNWILDKLVKFNLLIKIYLYVLSQPKVYFLPKHLKNNNKWNQNY